MAVQYPCTICVKDFSLQIKLKKHINSVHINEDGDYLDINVTLTSDDKVKYFDVLRFKYHNLLIKISLLTQHSTRSFGIYPVSEIKRAEDC